MAVSEDSQWATPLRWLAWGLLLIAVVATATLGWAAVEHPAEPQFLPPILSPSSSLTATGVLLLWAAGFAAYAIPRRREGRPFALLVIGGAAVVSFALGLASVARCTADQDDVLTPIWHAMVLFVGTSPSVFEADGVCGTSVPLALGESGLPLAAQLARFGAIAAVFGTAIALALTFAMRQWDRVWARAIRHDELVIGANPSSLPIIKTLLEWRRDLSDDADRRVNIAVLSLPGEEQTAQTVRDWGGRVHPIMIGTDRDPTSGNGAGNEDAYALNTMEDSDSDATRAQLKTQTARSLRPFLTTRGRPAVTRVWILHDDLELALNLQDSARAVLHSTRGPVWPGLRKSLYSWITRQKPDEQDAHDRLRARFVPRPVLRWLKDGASPRLEVRVVTLCDDRREAQNLRSQLMTQESRPRKVLEVKGATVTARKQTWVEVIVDPVCPDEVSATEVVGRVFARMKAVGVRDYHLVLCGDTALADAMLQALALRCWEQQRLDQAWEQFRLDTIVDPQVNEALPKIEDLPEESATPSPSLLGRLLQRFVQRRRGKAQESAEQREAKEKKAEQEKEQHKQAQKAREEDRDKLKKEISQRADPFPDDGVKRRELQERLTELEKSFNNGCDPDDLLVGGVLPASVIVVSPTASDLIEQWQLSAAPDVRNALSPEAVAVDWTDLKANSLPQAPLAVVVTESVDLSRSHLTERLNARLRPNCIGMWVLSRRITKSCPQSYADHEYAFAGNVLLNGRLPEDYWTRMARMQHEVFRRSSFDSKNHKRRPWWHRDEAMRLPLAPGMRWGRAGNLRQVRIFRQWLVQLGYHWGPIQPGADRWLPTDDLVERLSKLEQYRWIVENSGDTSASLDPREIPPEVLDHEWGRTGVKDKEKTRGTIRANFELMQALGYIPVLSETADSSNPTHIPGTTRQAPTAEPEAGLNPVHPGRLKTTPNSATADPRGHPMPQSPPRMFRRIGTVTAVRLTEPRTWATSSGDEMSGETGDWLVTDAKGGERTVKESEFPSLYQLLPDGSYQGIGTVTARQATATENIDTLEGRATANPGDWVVTAADGSSWPVPDEVFRTKYEEITSDE